MFNNKVNFNIDNEFKNYVFKYIIIQIFLSFIVFVFLYYNFGIKLAGLMMYIFLMLSFFIMWVDIKIQMRYFELKDEIKNIKYVIGIKKK